MAQARTPKTYTRFRAELKGTTAPTEGFRSDLHKDRGAAIKEVVDHILANGMVEVEEVEVMAKRETRYEEVKK